MSDTLEVKIGASDAGLEATLKTVQAELSNMEAKVKSGDLSMGELEKTMRRIAQVEGLETKLKAMGGEAADASPKVERLTRDLQDVGDKTAGLGGFFDSSFQKIAGAFTVGNIAAAGFNKAVDLAFTSAQAVVQSFGEALDLGGRLNELSARTGESAGKLLVLETAFKNAGLGADTVGTAINKLQNFMQDATNGGDKQVATMNRLGISLADLQGKTPTEQMQLFADKIAAIDDPTQRAATASDVFGDKLGGKLLPLLTDFSPAIEDARDKVGSMEQVMDENAATFDAAGETVDAVKGKMVAFAAGVLGEVIPAVNDLGTSMEKVDAAGLGQEVGEYLAPILQNLTDVTRGAVAVLGDLAAANTKAANDTGILGTAYRGVTESLDGFNKMMADSFNKFTPFGYLMETLSQRGKDLRESQDSAAEGVANAGNAAEEAAGKIGEVGSKSDEATGKVGALGTQAEATGESIASSFSLNSDFVPQLDSVASAWGGINEQVTGNQELLTSNLSLGESIVGKAEEQKQSIGGANEQLAAQEQLAKTIDDTYGKHAEKAAQVAAKQAEIAAKEAERKERLQESLNFDLQIAEAKASGNKEMVTSLESQKEFNAELKKAIDAGMGEPEARGFAQAMINAKTAADGIAGKVVNISVTTSVNDKPYKELMASLDATPNEKTINLALEVTGQNDLVAARQVLDACESKNVTAAFEATGTQSLEELANKINGLPNQKSSTAAMEITGEDDLDTALGNLQRFAGTKNAKLVLEKYGFENMTELINQLKGVPDEKTAKLTAQAFGLEDVSKVNAVLDTLMEKNGKIAQITATADASSAEQTIAGLGGTTVTLPTAADTSGAQNDINNLGGTVTLDLDAEQSIENIRTALKEGIELDISAKSGTSGILEQIKVFVEQIKTAVEKIEPKLPVAALTA